MACRASEARTPPCEVRRSAAAAVRVEGRGVAVVHGGEAVVRIGQRGRLSVHAASTEGAGPCWRAGARAEWNGMECCRAGAPGL